MRDLQFIDHPRVLIGLEPGATKVIHSTKADEEARYRGLGEKRLSVGHASMVEEKGSP